MADEKKKKTPEREAYEKEYRLTHKSEMKVYKAEYYIKNKEQLMAKQKASYDPSKRKAYVEDYAKRNPEKILESRKIYYQKTKDKQKLRSKLYREKNKSSLKQRSKEYRSDNVEKLKLRRQTLSARYRVLRTTARVQELDLQITEDQYNAHVVGAVCHYCSGPLPLCGHGLDRIDNSLGYVLTNVIPCCSGCNRFRSNNLTVDETRVIVDLLRIIREVPLHEVWPKKS